MSKVFNFPLTFNPKLIVNTSMHFKCLSAKNYRMLFLFLFLVIINCCCSFKTLPKIDPINIDDRNIQNVSLKYNIIMPPRHEWKTKYRLLIQRGLQELEFKELVSNQYAEEGYFFKISITDIVSHQAGIEFLTGLSFGIIPTYTPECDYLTLKYELFKDNKLVKWAYYKVSIECFNWLLVAPIAWGPDPYNNDFRLKETMKNMTKNFLVDMFQP